MRTKISKHIWNGNHGQSNECKRDPAQPIPKFSKHCTVKRGKTDANVYLNKLLAAMQKQRKLEGMTWKSTARLKKHQD